MNKLTALSLGLALTLPVGFAQAVPSAEVRRVLDHFRSVFRAVCQGYTVREIFAHV